MDDTVEKVAERLAQLERTVAEGFHENTKQFDRVEARIGRLEARFDARFGGLDARLDALDNKIGVSVESLRGDLKTVVEILTAHIAEMRRTTESIRKEGAADREILKRAILNHEAIRGSRVALFNDGRDFLLTEDTN